MNREVKQIHTGDWAQAETWENEAVRLYSISVGEPMVSEPLTIHATREEAVEALRGTIEDLQSILGWIENDS